MKHRRRKTAECILDGATTPVRYDAACQIGKRPYDNKFEHMGDGIVCGVWGHVQLGVTRLSFFKIKQEYRGRL